MAERKIKNIGIIIIETGAEDGVWLETVKIMEILKSRGFNIKIFTGSHAGKPYSEHMTINSRLTPRDNISERIYNSSIEFPPCEVSPAMDDEMKSLIQKESTGLEKIIKDWIIKEKIDLVISENANAIPMHVPLGRAIKNVVEAQSIPAIFHEHDFPWEREKYMKTPFPSVREEIARSFPGRTEKAVHVVINDLNKRSLKKRTGLSSVKLPNIMNFEDASFAKVDDYNQDMLSELGIGEDALILGQVTRVVRRKNIEASIELLNELNSLRRDERAVLVITGGESIGDKTHYKAALLESIDRYGLDKQVFWVWSRVKHKRGKTGAGKKIYSLSDFYAMLNTKGIMSYPSTYEGFGNAFVEAVLARVHILVNEYPVFGEEIGKYGFHVIRMKNGKITPDVVSRVNNLLKEVSQKDPRASRRVEENFRIGRKYFSYNRAGKILERAMARAVTAALGDDRDACP